MDNNTWTHKIKSEHQNINHESLLTIIKELQEKVEELIKITNIL